MSKREAHCGSSGYSMQAQRFSFLISATRQNESGVSDGDWLCFHGEGEVMAFYAYDYGSNPREQGWT
jgi:hypothetical protein